MQILNLRAICSSVNENSMFLSTASQSLKATHKVGEIVYYPQLRDVCLKPPQIILGTHAERLKTQRTSIHHAINIEWVLLCGLPRFTEIFLELSVIQFHGMAISNAGRLQSFCQN